MFFAAIIFDGPGGRQEVDARPSDAVNLALAAGAPIRGTARAEHDPGVQRRYADAVTADLGWSPTPGRFHLFAVGLDDVTFIRYDNVTGDQHVARWPPGREFIRRGDGGTSLRAAEPAHDIITG